MVNLPNTPPVALPGSTTRAAGSGSTSAAASDTAMRSLRNRFGPVIAVLGVAGAAWFMKESYKGNKDIWEQNAAHHHTEAEMNALRETWGMDSGHPTLDHAEHTLKNWLQFGPHGILTHYHEGHAKTHGFIHDVILSNLAPIGLAITSIYVGFGPKNVHNTIKRVFSPLMPKGNSGQAARVGEAAVRGAEKTVAGSAKGIAWLFKGGRAPITIILGAFGLYGLHQFRRVWHHTAQEDRFRPFITGHSDH